MQRIFSLSPVSVGFLFALGSAALFAIRPIFVKLVYAEGTDPTTLIGFRMLFSLPVYLVILVWLLRSPELRGRLTLRNISQAAIVGWFGYYFASLLDLLGLQYVTAQLGRMVLYVYPTFVVLFGALLFQQRITLRTLISLLITYTGVLIIFGHDLDSYGSDVIKGSLLILACAVSFAFYLLFSKSLIKDMGSRLFTSIALISASVAILVHYATTRSVSAPNVTPTALFWVFIIAMFCTVIPTFLTTSAVARIGADKTGIVAMVGPGFTSVFAVSILQESFTLYHLAGVTITILGVWVLSRTR
ncbi:permease [Arenicella chitinivorans]|uniref:Permease n=1 Tax=Arenicella chitinivorans TaxID=1329800 RepID=A0A918RJ06_9GAMM|nr:DMT family transporter [Arenicella chitinivorans]GGZ99842.1 permease [Arenicella chitinivorans]